VVAACSSMVLWHCGAFLRRTRRAVVHRAVVVLQHQDAAASAAVHSASSACLRQFDVESGQAKAVYNCSKNCYTRAECTITWHMVRQLMVVRQGGGSQVGAGGRCARSQCRPVLLVLPRIALPTLCRFLHAW
jgi:hypothetical protein